MSSLLMLIPVALVLGLFGLLAFLWALRSGQFDDLDGAAHRILFDEDDNPVAPPTAPPAAPPAADKKADGPPEDRP